jgi:outer membrane protein assembly factor BamB
MGCSRKSRSEVVWETDLPIIGSQSSPRTTDLNNDGVLDIVMGAGKNESQKSDQGVLAFDGRSGKLIWAVSSNDQVYGSATFYDVTMDGIEDVFIGGRSPNLKAIDGSNGNILWEYQYENKHGSDAILRNARFNFNNSILVPDQSGDGLPDLLTVNGGNSLAVPNSESNRHPGVMILFDIQNGTILAADTMPDGKETYMSPIGFSQPESDEFYVIFGTGGETVSGHLFKITLHDFLDHNLSASQLIATEAGHGFIAPPVAADINKDGYYDIIAISHASTAFAIDGRNSELIWKTKIPNKESSNSFAVGYFNQDDVPDFFTFVSKGEWPNNTGSLQIMLNGIDGRIGFIDSVGCTGFSSPVIYDLNKDGIDEAIISINEFDCNKGFVTEAIQEIENKVLVLNFKTGTAQTIDQAKGFKNIFSTPWLGDLDGNGYLDLIYCQYFSRGGLLAFLGMRIKRVELPIEIDGQELWGAYMGSEGDGLFNPHRFDQ